MNNQQSIGAMKQQIQAAILKGIEDGLAKKRSKLESTLTDIYDFLFKLIGADLP